jgi:hypothetical protein
VNRKQPYFDVPKNGLGLHANEADTFGAAQAESAIVVLDLSQNLVHLWRGSNFTLRREILDCVSSNRVVSGGSLVLTENRPFDILAEGPFSEKSRGDCPNFKPRAVVVERFVDEILESGPCQAAVVCA